MNLSDTRTSIELYEITVHTWRKDAILEGEQFKALTTDLKRVIWGCRQDFGRRETNKYPFAEWLDNDYKVLCSELYCITSLIQAFSLIRKSKRILTMMALPNLAISILICL
jgi:hypothetical protein